MGSPGGPSCIVPNIAYVGGMKHNLTASNPSAINLDAFLELYLDPTHTLPSIARALATSVISLVRFMLLPDIEKLLLQLETITKSRSTIVSGAVVEAVLRDFHNLPGLPENPSSLDINRRRLALDSVRRAAELLIKLATPPTIRKPKPDPTPALVLAPQPAPSPASSDSTPTPSPAPTEKPVGSPIASSPSPSPSSSSSSPAANTTDLATLRALFDAAAAADPALRGRFHEFTGDPSVA
jgi:hypothetical protein